MNRMPRAMLVSFEHLTENERLTFLLSGLQSRSTIEWPNVYESIAQWVYGLYKTRKIKYELLEKENEKK